MSKWKNNSFICALKNSINGLKFVFKNERNIKIQSVFALFAIIMSFLLKISLLEFGFIIIVIFIVFISEFFNTSVEKTVDMITNEYNENAKIVKDISASAVTLAAILAILIGVIIFLPKILNIINGV